MKSVDGQMKRMIVGAAAIAAALAGPSLSTAQTSTTDSTTTSSTEESITVATEEMICEAKQRKEARREKFLADGTPEEFGSEEPFTFDPSKC